jgi:hypothetical protein
MPLPSKQPPPDPNSSSLPTVRFTVPASFLMSASEYSGTVPGSLTADMPIAGITEKLISADVTNYSCVLYAEMVIRKAGNLFTVHTSYGLTPSMYNHNDCDTSHFPHSAKIDLPGEYDHREPPRQQRDDEVKPKNTYEYPIAKNGAIDSEDYDNIPF